MAYVYIYTRLDKNEVFYVGIGSDKNKYRAKNKKARNLHWKKIVSKTDYKIDIILDNVTWEEACQKEIELINLYGRHDKKKGNLVNFTDGGEGRLGAQDVITPLYQIDLNENIINEWQNVQKVVEFYKISKICLYSALNGKRRTCLNHIWMYVKDYSINKVKDIIKNKKEAEVNRLKNVAAKRKEKMISIKERKFNRIIKRKIEFINENTKEILNFNSMKEAAIFMNCSMNAIYTGYKRNTLLKHIYIIKIIKYYEYF
jgi:hypothetical protein